MAIIQDYLKSIVAMIDREPPEGYKYKCMEEFVLGHGRTYCAQPLPEGFRRGIVKQCYKNSFLLATENPDLVYVEGFALSIIPTAHAWCVDHEGNVVDPTWDKPENCQYFGIPFRADYVIETACRTEMFGIIDNWQDGWPVMKEPSEMWKHEETPVH